MIRIISVAAGLVIAMTSFATERLNWVPEQTSIATTGQIIKMDSRARTMVVRRSDAPIVQEVPGTKQTWQASGGRTPGIMLPGGITIALPGRNGRTTPQTAQTKAAPEMRELTVVTTTDTEFQDGADPIRFDDFKKGETVSIHGQLSGTVLTASRIAKWD